MEYPPFAIPYGVDLVRKKPMKYKVIRGKNCKDYIQVYDAQPGEEHLYKKVEEIVSRTEYKPFSRGFNKNVHVSYFFNSHFFPAQFLSDVKHGMKVITGKEIEVEDEHLLYYEFARDDFDEYIESLKFPEKYNLQDERYKYQPDSAYLALVNKIARVDIATGGGKTFMTYLYCKVMNEIIIPKFKDVNPAYQILIVVPRKDLCVQLKQNFEEYESLMTRKLIVETIYSGSKRIIDADVVVGTYQSLKEYEKEYFDNFFAFICDEVHTGKSYSIRSEIYAKMTNIEFCFGMTGTFPKYNTLDYLNIVSMFGNCVLKRTTKELKSDGIVSDVRIHKIIIEYNDEEKLFSENLREQGIIGSEKYHVEKQWFEHHFQRNLLMVKLQNNIPGNNLILVDSVEYCEYLKRLFDENTKKYCKIIYGSTKDSERLIIKEEMEKREDMTLIATYGTMSTGVSINNIMNLYFPDGGKSEIRVKQSLGRGLRLHPKKEYLNVFDFQDVIKCSSFRNHALARNRIYNEEGHKTEDIIVKLK